LNILAISGSVRSESTNTCFLREIACLSPPDEEIELLNSLETIPIFNPDREGKETPAAVLALCKKIAQCDGIIISSPEYIRSIPGGLKNAIDWLVSRDEIIGKPIALVHVSHRGDDVLDSLRRVLSTVSENFAADIFLRIPLIGTNEAEIKQIVNSEENRLSVEEFISEFCRFIRTVPVEYN
jgi:chromate reductase, NAD(P)H dehydrogenase (quinone)